MWQVSTPRAPLKSRPEDGASYASELLFGESFTVYDDESSWAWGQAAADQYVGYVPSAALGHLPAATHWVAALSSHVYPGPDLKLPPLMPLYLGSRVALQSTVPDKGFLPLASGGWVFAAHVRPLGDWAMDFVLEAERFLGAPYHWGGRSVAGIDCSGLVQMALSATGRDCARDTDQQAASIGRPVSLSEPRTRGDIVFFPGHVGIMLDATQLLHANATHMAVTINPLDEVIAIVAKTAGEPVSGIRRVD
nr:C40 family peptidase [Govania unica]